MQYLDAISKTTNDLCSFLRQSIQYHNNPSLYPDQWCWRSWSWTVLWRSLRLSRTNTQKRYAFHYRGLECKSTRSRNTWSNSQIQPWNTEWSRAKANRVWPRERTGHSKHPPPTTQEKTLHMDSKPDGQHWKQIDYTFFSAKDGEALYSQQKQDQKVTVAQIMNSLLPNSDLSWRK